jgi:hypothetical protein
MMATDDPQPSGASADAEPVVYDDPAVLAVLPDEAGAAEVVGLDPEQLSGMIAGLQGQLAGTGRTGIPEVDAALERLSDLDPNDLSASADVLADVLKRLESAMGDKGHGPGPADA